jgi:predicted metal-dependent phosphoesterase TrpH
MDYANLHTHTLFSDGQISPPDLLKAVYASEDLKCFALTDHDSMSGIEPLFRCKRDYESDRKRRCRRFIPGIELTLSSKEADLVIHLLGLFPHIDEYNYKDELERIEAVIGDYCRYRAGVRGERDLDGRVEYAFEINLEGIADRYASAEEIIRTLREKADEEGMRIFKAFGKEEDVIQHPIPVTYRVMIEHWQELVPVSSAEKMALYIYRPDKGKEERLAHIYRSEGMVEKEAQALAEKNQSLLYNFKRPLSKGKTIYEGLDLLKRAGAVTFLAHPAVDYNKIGLKDYDNHVLFPLVERGLDGIEVVYPYDKTYRDEVIAHYGRIAAEKGLLITGGTDFHGDERVGLDDVKLDIKEAERIIDYRTPSKPPPS